MANTVVSLFSIVLLCITAAQGRKKLHSNSYWPKSPSVISGICKTMAETQVRHYRELFFGWSQVTTEDGYILSLQRLPAGRSGKKADKPPVLLQHGLLFDAITWLFNTPDESLGFILADNGYDVWLANVRGTKYSRRHRSLNPNDMAYWDWSWDQLASYDLPTFVQYVYSHTGQQMHYAGHSLGTLMALAALSQGQLLDMLRSAALLCPVAHLNQITSQVARLLADTFIANLNILLMSRDATGNLVEGICHNLNLNCSNLLTPLTGPNCCVNSSTFNAFLDHGIQPTATRNLIHLSQISLIIHISVSKLYHIFKEFPAFSYPSRIIRPNCFVNSSAFNVFLDHGIQPTAIKNLIHLSQIGYSEGTYVVHNESEAAVESVRRRLARIRFLLTLGPFRCVVVSVVVLAPGSVDSVS
ncbi:Triacylglycerol lipase 2 [Spatholobus suberectus]|nr:Triacylglycerol lipase 2 [Spatholobus suberectus]